MNNEETTVFNTIQYASDLHLEVGNLFKSIIEPFPTSFKDILILAGDIGDPYSSIFVKFMTWCTVTWKYVYLLPGNSEYHGSSIEVIDELLRVYAIDIGFRLLDSISYYTHINEHGKSFAILGGTLWAPISKEGSRAIDVLDDFKLIKELKDNPLYINDIYKMHYTSIRDNIKELRSKGNIDIIVVTHHAPLLNGTMPPKYKYSTEGFASNCSCLMKDVNVWIFGHTNMNTEFNYSSTLILSNQRGYHGACKGYKKCATLKI